MKWFFDVRLIVPVCGKPSFVSGCGGVVLHGLALRLSPLLPRVAGVVVTALLRTTLLLLLLLLHFPLSLTHLAFTLFLPLSFPLPVSLLAITLPSLLFLSEMFTSDVSTIAGPSLTSLNHNTSTATKTQRTLLHKIRCSNKKPAILF